MLSRYNDLIDLFKEDIPHCADVLILRELQQTGREFCRKTEAWHERLTFNIVDSEDAYQTAYDAAIANGMSVDAAIVAGNTARDAALVYNIRPHYEADVIRPWKVWDHGDDTQPVVNPQSYDFSPSLGQLTFHSALQTYTPVATTWTTGIAYAAGDYVIYSSLRYMCAIAHTAGTWATDLAAYRWQLMPNDLLVDAVLMPRVNCVELAGWFMEKWAEGIIAGAKVRLMSMKNKNWSSPERVSYFQAEYDRYINLALRERFTQNKSTDIVFASPAFIR